MKLKPNDLHSLLNSSLFFWFLCFIANPTFAQIEPSLQLGYLSSHSNDHSLLQRPDQDVFSQQIFADPIIFTHSLEQLGGEILEIGPYGQHQLSLNPQLSFQLRYMFDDTWGIYGRIGRMSGQHEQDFNVLYVDLETGENVETQGLFSAARNDHHFNLGLSMRMHTKVPLTLNYGVVLNQIQYKSADAQIGDFVFPVADAHSQLNIGVRLNPEISIPLLQDFSVLISPDLIVSNVNQQLTPYVGMHVGIGYVAKKKKHKTPPVIISPPEREAFWVDYASVFLPKIGIQREKPSCFHLNFPNTIQNGEYLIIGIPEDALSFGIHDLQWTNPIASIDSLLAVKHVYLYGASALAVYVPFEYETGLHQLDYQLSSLDNTIEKRSIFFHLQSENPSSVQLSMSPEEWKRYTDAINDVWEKWRKAGARRDSLQEKIYDEWDDMELKRKLAKALIDFDEKFERYVDYTKDEVNEILDSLENMKDNKPYVDDLGALGTAIAEKEKEIDDCEDQMEALEAEEERLKEKCKELKEKQDKLREEIHDLYTENGFEGRSYYGKDGKLRSGYIGGENAKTDFGNLPWEKKRDKLKKELKALNKEYVDCLAKQKAMPARKAAQVDACAQLQAELEAAKQRKAEGDAFEALQGELEQECEWLQNYLKKLQAWCEANPEHCTFGEDLQAILKGHCPQSREEWEELWDEIDDLLKQKKALEDELGTQADAAEARMKKAEQDHEDAEDEVGRLAGELDGLRKARADRSREIKEQGKLSAAAKEKARKARIAAEKKKLNDCLEKLAAWLKENEDKLDEESYNNLKKAITDGTAAVLSGGAETASSLAKGSSVAVAGLRGAALGIMNLLTGIAYAIIEGKLKKVSKQLGNEILKNKIAAAAILEKDPCGVIEDGNKSYFYMKVKGKIITFHIDGDGQLVVNEVS